MNTEVKDVAGFLDKAFDKHGDHLYSDAARLLRELSTGRTPIEESFCCVRKSKHDGHEFLDLMTLANEAHESQRIGAQREREAELKQWFINNPVVRIVVVEVRETGPYGKGLRT